MKSDPRPVIFDYHDNATKTRNTLVTARGAGRIQGIALNFERESLGEGLYFRRATDGKEFAVQDYTLIAENEIRFTVPALVRSGIFTLLFRTMRNNQPVEIRLPRGLEFSRKPVLTHHRAVFVRNSPSLPHAPYYLYRGALMELRGANLNLHNRSGYELVLVSETGVVEVVHEFYNPAGNECRIRYRVPTEIIPGPYHLGIRYREGGQYWMEFIPRKYIVTSDMLFPITDRFESEGSYHDGLYTEDRNVDIYGGNLPFSNENKKEGVFFVCEEQGRIVRADDVEFVEENQVRFRMPYAGRICFMVLAKQLRQGLFTSEPMPLQEWAEYHKEDSSCRYNTIS